MKDDTDTARALISLDFLDISLDGVHGQQQQKFSRSMLASVEVLETVLTSFPERLAILRGALERGNFAAARDQVQKIQRRLQPNLTMTSSHQRQVSPNH